MGRRKKWNPIVNIRKNSQLSSQSSKTNRALVSTPQPSASSKPYTKSNKRSGKSKDQRTTSKFHNPAPPNRTLRSHTKRNPGAEVLGSSQTTEKPEGQDTDDTTSIMHVPSTLSIRKWRLQDGIPVYDIV